MVIPGSYRPPVAGFRMTQLYQMENLSRETRDFPSFGPTLYSLESQYSRKEKIVKALYT